MHACTHARMHACTHARMHACTHARMHACTHARMHACTHARMHACTHARMHAFTHARTHARTHAHNSLMVHNIILTLRVRLQQYRLPYPRGNISSYTLMLTATIINLCSEPSSSRKQTFLTVNSTISYSAVSITQDCRALYTKTLLPLLIMTNSSIAQSCEYKFGAFT